jgi:hypothetical protein
MGAGLRIALVAELASVRAQPTDRHPVCAAILGFVNAGKKGSEVRKQFASCQYGWPQDAIDGTKPLSNSMIDIQFSPICYGPN